MKKSAAETTTTNIASLIPLRASNQPDISAIIVPHKDQSITFGSLEKLSSRLAKNLETLGISRGMRVLMFVKPGIEFSALTFALFRLGAVPVLIDPGMGKKNLLSCIRDAKAGALIALPIVHVLKIIYRRAFSSIKINVTVGQRWFWGGASYASLASGPDLEFPVANTKPDDLAAILFTSGSTGTPKGVEYCHGHFLAQVENIGKEYGIAPGDVDLPTFPLFGLFSTALGATCVIPDMDFTRPASVNPDMFVDYVRHHHVSFSFGSPALWNRITNFCLGNGIILPQLRFILSAGAPVPPKIISRFSRILKEGADIFTPYGATESLPVTSFSGSRIVKETWPATKKGLGYCVGNPVGDMKIRIMKIMDDEVPEWHPDLDAGKNEIGEILVRGSVVTKNYFNRPEADKLSKVKDGSGFWHRMGDLGYLDLEGKLWFCGRKAHRVITPNETMYTIPCESVFNECQKVYRCALVGIGKIGMQKPVIVIEPDLDLMPKSKADRELFTRELVQIAKENDKTKHIDTFLFHPSLPVDTRHNAKINRELLAKWAAKELGVGS